MPRDIEEPTFTDTGSHLGEREAHPAFGMVSVRRVTSSPGASLFDSEIRHQHYVTLRVSTATRHRALHRDWIHPDEAQVEIAMSEAQWAGLVSSFDSDGVPCTLQYTSEKGTLPGIPFRPRMEQSQAEVSAAAREIFEKAMAALATAEEKPTKANLRALRLAMENAAPNVEYAARTLTEHVENVVTKARADIEAMVDQRAHQVGLPSSARPVLGIESGGEPG